MTIYESMEKKVQLLRDTAVRCMRAVSRATKEAEADRLLDMALLWSKKADELTWKLNHLTIGEAESLI